MGDVARHIGRSDPVGLQPGLLDVDCPHLGPLGVGEHGQVHRARRMVFSELGRATHVDDGLELRQRPQVRPVQQLDPRQPSGPFITGRGSGPDGEKSFRPMAPPVERPIEKR